jgi:uncharacterized protein YgbK (DUF1537 family)
MSTTHLPIIVVSDDFTGAAEIAGSGFSYGLETQLLQKKIPNSLSDLTVVDSGIRSMDISGVLSTLESLIDQLKTAPEHRLFLKIDSVMRGHVLQMVECFLELDAYRSAVVLPGNPAIGRWINNGVFMINEAPLHLTEFSHDPEYPVRDSSVQALLGDSEKYKIGLIEPGTRPRSGNICIGNLTSDADLNIHLKTTSEDSLIVGGAAAFEAMLRYRLPEISVSKTDQSQSPSGNILLVLGSRSQEALYARWVLADHGTVISYFPAELTLKNLSDPAYMDIWKDDVLKNLKMSSIAVIAVDGPTALEEGIPPKLTECMARVVTSVREQISINELIIEGGATATEVLSCFRDEIYKPSHIPEPGVVQFSTENSGMNITTKVGSYEWPTGSILTYLNP